MHRAARRLATLTGDLRCAWHAVPLVAALLVASCSSAAGPTSGAGTSSTDVGPTASSITTSSLAAASPIDATPSAASPIDATPSATSSAIASASASATAVGGSPGEPDPRLTPGATNPAVTQTTIDSTICVAGWTATVRPPSGYTTSLKRDQIAAYGYADMDLADYEEDHLIPLELGGAPSDPRNLWPEPYTVSLADGTPDGARVKDQLENKLRSLVCAGALPLAAAQRAIATDWVRAWLTYLGPASAVPSPG